MKCRKLIGAHRRGTPALWLWARLLIPVVIATGGGPAVAETDDLDGFVSTLRCSLTGRLAGIHARGDFEREDERFLILVLGYGETNYVQCAFFDNDLRMICEAASGYYNSPKGEARTVYLPAVAIASLAKLGLSTDDSHGNFQRVVETPHPADFGSVADLVLGALHEAYGARLDTKIEVHSALVKYLGAILKPSNCAPTS